MKKTALKTVSCFYPAKGFLLRIIEIGYEVSFCKPAEWGASCWRGLLNISSSDCASSLLLTCGLLCSVSPFHPPLLFLLKQSSIPWMHPECGTSNPRLQMWKTQEKPTLSVFKVTSLRVAFGGIWESVFKQKHCCKLTCSVANHHTMIQFDANSISRFEARGI